MKTPRLLQSILSAVGDLYLYKLSKVVFGDYVAKWAVSFYVDSAVTIFFILLIIYSICFVALQISVFSF